jgi:hypothetical protein
MLKQTYTIPPGGLAGRRRDLIVIQENAKLSFRFFPGSWSGLSHVFEGVSAAIFFSMPASACRYLSGLK